MKKAILLILLVSSQSLAYALDRTSADAAAAKYRTGKIDSAVLKVPSEIEKGLRQDPEKYLKRLVSFLSRGTDDDFVKVKRFHDWITENIAYDNDDFYGKGKKGHVLKDRRTTCGGFAGLFKKMAELAGLEAITIDGKSRVTYDSVKKEMANHTWNAVKIRGKWYIVDPTHDSRFSYTNRRFRRKSRYRDTYLFVSPGLKILRNFPDDPAHQFLEKPMDFDAFIKHPLVEVYHFVRSGIRFVSDMEKMVKKERKPLPGGRFVQVEDKIYIGKGTVTIEVEAPENVSVFARVLDEKGKKYDAHAVAYREKDMVICRFSAPGKGIYRAYISSRVNPEDRLYQKAYPFTLVGTTGKGSEFPLPYRFYTYSHAAYYGVSVLDHNLNDKNARSYFLRVKYPSHVRVFSWIWNEKDKKIPSGTAHSVISRDDKSTTVEYRYEVPQNGTYFIKLRVKNAAERYYTDTAAVVKMVK
jgi:transglutaminase/protease-like cytokinesis protein 3